MHIRLIAAVDRHWAIGYQNQLLFHIPEDMRRFRALTQGNVVVMGRKTLLTLPNAKPLAGRENIVLTRNAAFTQPGAVACTSLMALHDVLLSPPYADKQIFIIGGAEIYALLLPYAAVAHITHVYATRQADCYFPPLTQNHGWRLSGISSRHTQDGYVFAYATYHNKRRPLPLNTAGDM